jgi:hypothetical protein
LKENNKLDVTIIREKVLVDQATKNKIKEEEDKRGDYTKPLLTFGVFLVALFAVNMKK